MKQFRFLVLATTLLMSSLSAFAWWDTAIQVQRQIPLLKEFEAEKLPGVPQAAIRTDAQANGGQGGPVVALAPNSNIKLTVEADLQRSTYALWAIARPDQPFENDKRPPAFFTLEVTQPDGAKKSWTMPVTYVTHYEAIAQIYFPAHVAGKYSLSMSLDAKSEMPFLVDRLELHDALLDTARKGVKTKPMLFTPQEREAVRAEAAQSKDVRFSTGPYRRMELPVTWPAREAAPQRTIEERRATAEKLWSAVPDYNAITERGSSAYNWIIGRDKSGLIKDGSDLYHRYADTEAAWDAAVLLAALAEKYPALDLRVQGDDKNHGITNPNPFTFSLGQGKFVYSGWAPGDLLRLTTAYDQLFDYIKDNQALADYIGTKIPWVKTPQDVVTLIDVNLLQSGFEAKQRRQLRSDELSVYVPLVLGPSDVADKMLDEGIFSRVHMNMADAGGIDDQIFTAYNRDGVRYIGSVLYIGDELIEIAKILNRYVQAGGNKKYDLLDTERYPHLTRARRTIEATTVAGGFPLVIGDARDLHFGRNFTDHAAFPSRVLGGFGVAILEDGQNADSASAKRAVAVRTGMGVGHAQQDTLNLDITALGTRLAPDLGGRHEGANKGDPNMRWNRVHNLVEVDATNFHNIVPGSTTGGTGWTRLFSPVPGAQAMINAGRATSHPQVSLYERTTAMIDGPVSDDTAPIYVFDVFRVAGGQSHTYAFHGAESQQFETNAKLQEATSKPAVDYLFDHKDGSKQEGKAPAILEATWQLRDEMAKRWLGVANENARRHTRLSLLGQQGQDVFVGNATSDHYKYDFPFLYVQRRGEEGLQSAFTAIIETFAGEPFIASKRALTVTPNDTSAQSATAAEVVLKNGRRDVLFAGGRPETVRQIEGGVTANGEFGFWSEDENGLRQMHLAGGTQLRKGDLGIVAERAEYSGKVAEVNHAKRTFTVNAPVPTGAAVSEVALLGSKEHPVEFNLSGATPQGNSSQILSAETPQFYQSVITQIDPATNSVVTELEPTVTRSDPKYYDGAIASNEAGNQFWKVRVNADERWMHLGWPGYRTSWPNTISMNDVPDSDGDGKHELRLIGGEGDKEKKGQELLTLNVTRVTDNGQTFFFEMPKEEEYQQGGWQYNFRTLVNEDGTKTWRSLYPGVSYRFMLEGAPVTDAAFADADGDGKRKLKIYHYGPGSDFTLPARVAVTRVAPGEWEVRANVESTLMLPGKGKAQIKSGEADWKPLAAQQKGDVVTVKITSAMLSDKPLRVKVGG